MAAAAPALTLAPRLTGLAGALDSGPLLGSGHLDASGLTGVALSWFGADPHEVVATVRARVDGAWLAPVDVRADHGHGPEASDGRTHSPAVLIPPADRLEITLTRSGARDLRLHPLAARPRTLDFAAVAPTIVEPIPGLQIIERSSWTDVDRLGAPDCVIGSSLDAPGCRSDVGIRHAVVHHTVTPNGYSASDVPALLRGIQQHHMGVRGWYDIGYNFVVDRFGRIWQARQAELLEPVVGGHTLGLNAESVGVAVLGTFTSATPDPAVRDAIGRLLGWKLSLHGVDPMGHTLVRSSGGDYAEPGDMVDVRNISGHRDHQQTSCPGNGIDNHLDEIRATAAELVPVYGHLSPRYALDAVTLDGWAMDRFDPAGVVEVDVVVDGGAPVTLLADGAVPGLDADYPGAGDDHGFHHLVPIDLDTTSIVVTARAGDGRTAGLMNLRLFATFIDVEPDRFFAPGVRFLREKELTTGTGPGLFEPMDEVTRGQMATFLHRFMDEPDPADRSPFTDLDPDGFYVEAVDWLHGAGITTGTTPTTFSPGEFVTRGQMATFLWRLCGRIPPSEPNRFDDVPATAYYARPVTWLAETGITVGTGPTTFSPDRVVTRGEMATFLHRLATTAAAWTVTPPPSPVEIPVEG